MTGIETIPASTANQWAQYAHFFSAYSVVFTFGHFWGWKGLLVGGAVILLWATVKEWYLDPRHESVVVQGSGLLDWGMYLAGAVTAGLLEFLGK